MTPNNVDWIGMASTRKKSVIPVVSMETATAMQAQVASHFYLSPSNLRAEAGSCLASAEP